MITLTKNKLFNPDGNDDIEKRKMVGGSTTNLLNLTNVKYKWTVGHYRMCMENFWIPEKNDLTQDIKDYKGMPKDIQNVYDNIISSLVFLDSLQTNNLPRICDYITDSSISLLLTIQSFQEAIHSQSYAYIISSIIPKEKMENFYDRWKSNKILEERNSFLVRLYQNFHDNPSNENFFIMLLADYILESINFYLGFSVFYEITHSLGKMVGTSDIIRLIQRDELTHVVLFKRMIEIFILEENIKVNEKMIRDLFITASENEIQLFNQFIGNKSSFLNISKENASKYVKFLCDSRIKDLGFKPIYHVDKDPLSYLSHVSDQLKDIQVKSNFFETNVGKYNMYSAMEGWDKL